MTWEVLRKKLGKVLIYENVSSEDFVIHQVT